MGVRVCLAVTCHDPLGAFAEGIAATDALWPIFDAVVVNATEETHPHTFDAIAAKSPRGVISRHRAGSIGIGAARREALRMAVRTECTHVLYSDLDHVLRWAASDADELCRTATPLEGSDCTVIGRSRSAFALEPARLRATESVVNEAARLAVVTIDPNCDFMMAVRLVTREAAEELVANCLEETIGNDVAWPLHLLQVACEWSSVRSRGWSIAIVTTSERLGTIGTRTRASGSGELRSPPSMPLPCIPISTRGPTRGSATIHRDRRLPRSAHRLRHDRALGPRAVSKLTRRGVRRDRDVAQAARPPRGSDPPREPLGGLAGGKAAACLNHAFRHLVQVIDSGGGHASIDFRPSFASDGYCLRSHH